jgi:hypothetical protein
VRAPYALVVAELPHRVANDLFQRYTGVTLSSWGAQGLIDSTAQDLQRWQAEKKTQEATAVAEALESGDSIADLRVEIAMDGVMAHIDGRWQHPKVATILVRRLAAQAKEPTLGAVLARRYVCVLGTAEELATRIQQGIRQAGWERIPIGAIWAMARPGSGLWRTLTFQAYVRRWTIITSASIFMPSPTSNIPIIPRGLRPGWSRKWGRPSWTTSGRFSVRSSACGHGKTPFAMCWPTS